MSKLTIDIISDTKTQTLIYDAVGFTLLEDTGVDDGHVKITRSQGTGAGLNLPVSWHGSKVLCIRLD